ncbi:hypothetical protein F0U60_10815 [Archangium minus]|uniref:HpcH/HpaI aldolase/citrate lyase domain-containing protein n=1 Tax=Archangium minus TaxID=83450 RepID=A0ABY9WN00_9BACT|nr:hypothetical protein F0U60_10815 [Archangium minus]
MRFTRYCRSILFTPALAADRFARGQQSGADISLVDLEDSVSPAHKDAARQRAEAFFSAPPSACRRAVRINSVTHHEGLKDLLALRSYPVKPDVVMVPKVESPRDLEIVEQSLGPDCAHMDLMAIVETARGLENVNAISCSISAPSSGDGGGPTEGEPLLEHLELPTQALKRAPARGPPQRAWC